MRDQDVSAFLSFLARHASRPPALVPAILVARPVRYRVHERPIGIEERPKGFDFLFGSALSVYLRCCLDGVVKTAIERFNDWRRTTLHYREISQVQGRSPYSRYLLIVDVVFNEIDTMVVAIPVRRRKIGAYLVMDVPIIPNLWVLGGQDVQKGMRRLME